jgi:hypothetical protein
MQNRLIVFLLLLSSLQGFSQAKESGQLDTTISKKSSFKKRAYIGVSGGYSLAMESFAAANADILASAYAKNGSSLQLLNAGFIIKESFSAKAVYAKHKHSVEANRLSNDLSQAGTLDYAVSASEYELNALLLGVGLSKQRNSIDLELHFLFGFGNIFLPSFNLIERNPANNTASEINFPAIKENGSGVGLSAGFRIHLNEYLDFTTDATYLIFEKEFEQLRIENGVRSSVNSSVTYEVLNLNIGLAYRFLNNNE